MKTSYVICSRNGWHWYVSAMKYGPERELIFKTDTYVENGKNVTYQTTYLGNYEKVYRTGGAGTLTEHKFYVGDIVYTQRSNGSSDTFYLHKDHQGSVIATTNASGAVVSQAIYDPWGKRTAVFLHSSFASFTTSEPTDRGYTGHKHIKDLDIIHMGGRIYDPTLGRFLQADPLIQAPTDSQSYNRYAYVRNNPLTLTDPSGYSWWSKTWKKIRPYVGIIVAAIGTYICGGNVQCGQAGYALVGAASGAAGAAANGGNVFTGALRGAFTAMAFYQVGEAFSQANCQSCFSGGELTTAATVGKIAAHAMVGGITSILQGGKFGHGFLAAGVTQGFEKSINGISSARFSIGRIVAAATVGGTISKLTGGKFANGALTGAFSRMFNDEAHHQSVRSRVVDAGKKALLSMKDMSSDLYDYASEKLESAGDFIASKLRKGLNVKFDASLTGGALGVGVESTVSLAFSKYYELGTFFTLSGGGFAGLGGGMSYSIGTWQGDLSTLEGFSGTVGGMGMFAGKGDFTFTGDGAGADIGTGLNVGYAAYGFVNHTWLIGRGFF